MNKDQDDNKTLEPNVELESISSEPLSNDNVTKPSCESKKVNPHEDSFNSIKKRKTLKSNLTPTARVTGSSGTNKVITR